MAVHASDFAFQGRPPRKRLVAPSQLISARLGEKPAGGSTYLVVRVGRGAYERLTLGEEGVRLAVSFNRECSRLGVAVNPDGWKPARTKRGNAAELWIPLHFFEGVALPPDFKARGLAEFIQDDELGAIAVLKLM